MDSLVEPLAALLAIVVPLWFAYLLVGLHARSKGQGKRKSFFRRRCVKHPVP